MLQSVHLIVFSPTGSTRKLAEDLARNLSETVTVSDLMTKDPVSLPEAELYVLAAPVYGGRIPDYMAQRLQTLRGDGRKAVVLAVYGNRHYDDALLEMQDILQARGFSVLGGAALIARHCMVPELAAGRPDEQDREELRRFAHKLLDKLKAGDLSCPVLPGNRPYREGMKVIYTPESAEGCTACGSCARICPVEAIRMENGKAVTELSRCILCLACTVSCPQNARFVPPEKLSGLREHLAPCMNVRRENEFYL